MKCNVSSGKKNSETKMYALRGILCDGNMVGVMHPYNPQMESYILYYIEFHIFIFITFFACFVFIFLLFCLVRIIKLLQSLRT